MPLYRTSDSLSRCDPSLYSNIYDVRKRPDLKQSPITTSEPKDTIEISREKLTKEALSHLRQPGKHLIAYNSFMRVGKYFIPGDRISSFLALYALPKWIIISGLLPLFAMPLQMWKIVKKKTEKHLQAGARQTTQMIQFMQHMATNLLIQPILRLTLEIQRRIQRLREHTLLFFGQISTKMGSTLRRPFLTIRDSFKRLHQRLHNRLSRIKEKILEKSETIVTQVQEKIQWIKQSPQLIWNWGKTQIQGLQFSWGIQWNKRFETSQAWAQRATHWVANQCNKQIESLKSDFQPFVTFYQQHIVPRWQKLKRIGEQTSRFFQQKHQKALNYLQYKQDRLKHLSHHRLIHHLSTWINQLPLSWKHLLNKCLAHPVCHAICEQVVKVYAFFASSFWRFLAQLLHLFSLGIKIAAKTISVSQTYLKAGQKNLLIVPPHSTPRLP